MNSFQQDKQARDAITSTKEKDIDTNFFVEASAGSGKTTSLVSRMVNMVKAERGRDVDKICAITFTKAAANEFYSRFREALAKEKDNERCKEALKNIDLAFMGTIDAFCQRILSEHPVEAGIPASFEHIDIDEQSLELKKALVNINTDSNHPLHDKYVSLRSLFRFTDVDTLILNGSLMYWERRDASLMIPTLSNDAFDGVIRDIKTLSDELRSIPKSNREENAKGSKAAWNAVYRLLRIMDWDNVDVGYLLDVLDDLTKSKNGYSDLRINPNPGQTFNSFYFERMTKGKKWQPIGNPFKTYKNQLQSSTYKDLLEFIGPFVHMESEELKKRGRLTYFDAKMALRDMLKADIEKNSSRLIKHIQQVHEYYLVDEFQDTDSMQAEILFYLTADEPKVNWRECKPKPGTLFIVGDPKQSIYRFRGADIASFRDVKSLFLNGAGKVETLTCNFRSSDKLCSEFNDIFSVLLEKHKDNSGSYDLTIPVNADAVDKGNMKVPNGSTMDGIYKYNPGECKNDPEEVRKIVSSIVHNPAFQIQDYLSYSKGGVTPVKTREVEYRDIMIITSRKDQLLLYMDEFKKADIPYVVEGAVMFGASFALRLTYYFMSYFASPCDKGALYGIKTIGGIDIENEEIKELQKRAGSLSPSALFSAVISLKTFEEHADTENFEYLYYALELLRSKEVSGEIISLQDTLSFLESLILGDSDNERCLQLERDNNAVRLANLHKVKGLEAPVVILAYPNCPEEPKADVRFERTENGDKCFIFDIKKDKGFTRSKPFWDNDERKSEVVSIYAERIRGLYVAATRARNILFVSSCGKNGEVWKELADCVDEKFDIDSVDISSANDYRDTVSGEYKKLELTEDVKEKSYSIQKPSDGHKAVKLVDEDSVEDDTAVADSALGKAAENEGSDSDASLRGTMVHRLMEIIVRRKGNSVSDGMLDYIVSEYVQSDESGKYKLMLKNVRDTLYSGGFDQRDGAPKDFISEIRDSEEAHAEVPFCYRDGNSIVNGVVDCLYKKKKDKDGREEDEWHIIDFKTNRDGNGLAEFYSGQLECYKEAFRTLVRGENIADSLIYHIDISRK